MSVGSFLKKVEMEFVKLFHEAPSFEQRAQSAIAIVGPIVVRILQSADPSIAPVVGSVLKTVQSDLATVSALTQAGQVAPGTPAAVTVTTALNAVRDNLSGMLQIAEIKNSTKVTEITNDVNMVVGELDALLGDTVAPAVA